MNTQILTSYRYIAILGKHGLTWNNTLRVLTKDDDGTQRIVPCRWSAVTDRLERVATDPGEPPKMYEATPSLIEHLRADGFECELLTETQARDLTIP